MAGQAALQSGDDFRLYPGILVFPAAHFCIQCQPEAPAGERGIHTGKRRRYSGQAASSDITADGGCYQPLMVLCLSGQEPSTGTASV